MNENFIATMKQRLPELVRQKLHKQKKSQDD